MSFNITLVHHCVREKRPYLELFWSVLSRIRTEYEELLLSHWCAGASHWDHGIPRNVRLNSIVVIDWFSFFFWLFVLSWELVVIYSKIFSQSSFNERLLCCNLELARLSYVNIFQDSQTQWSTARYVDEDVLCWLFLKDHGD